MQVGRWGNSLAVRLPASVVELLGLREGDEVVIEIAGPREFRLASDQSRSEALARLRRLDWPLPPGFAFSRPEGTEAGGDPDPRAG